MAGKQAKILDQDTVRAMIDACETHRYPWRDKVIVLLSAKAGLRAMEIANIRRKHIMTADKRIDIEIHLENKLCKKGSGRTIPINAELRAALETLFHHVPGLPNDPLILSERSMNASYNQETQKKVRPLPQDDVPYCMHPKSIVLFFQRLYDKLGLVGCSSHSGRRTFGTMTARKIVQVGGSLRDVQQLLGHTNLATTQRYIDGDSEAKRKVVELL